MDKQLREAWADGLMKGMRQGTVQVPALLLKYYHRLRLTELDAMILIQCLAFKQLENKDFPTHEELQSRLSAEPAAVIERIRKLVHNKVITIEEGVDARLGIRYERYNFDGLMSRLASFVLEDEWKKEGAESAETIPKNRQVAPVPPKSSSSKVESGRDIFTIFEKEFGRPLSPMECESISGWLDKDQYEAELILAALKEAVFSGKVHFRYIDRILLEWNRNRVFTLEQAREYTKRFRGNR